MNNVIFINFKTKKLKDTPPKQIIKQKTNKIGDYFCQHFELDTYYKIASRYGTRQPKDGVVYENPIYTTRSRIYIDAYGRGCVHNSDGNPFKKILSKQNQWNRPTPFPANIGAIYDFLKQDKTKRPIQLGLKSDAFMWMDQKYNLGLELIRMINSFNRNLLIYTCSDLIAMDTYIKALHPSNKIKIRIPTGMSEKDLRQAEPGAPSKARREKAVGRLIQAGIDVEVFSSLYWKVPKNLKTWMPINTRKMSGV